MTHYQIGDKVIASVQGFKEGAIYTVEAVRTLATAFGTFVTYVVIDANGEAYEIRNGHIVLERA